MWKLLPAAIVLGMCAVTWRIYESFDMGKTIFNHRPGICRQVHGPVHGSEDIELIRSEGIAFITSGILSILHQNRAHIEGKMFLYDFNQKQGKDQLVAQELPIEGTSFDEDNFHPQGITHWVVNGVIRLFVVNHSDDFQHSVEVFDYDPTGPALLHNKSIKHPRLVRPNDLVAIGPDQFFFTNDGMAQTEWGSILEMLSGHKGGSVFFYDGKKFHRILSSLKVVNGIAYDPKHSKLFVVETYYMRLNVYNLDKSNKNATFVSTVNLNSACDNLFLDSDGSLYSGCHPVFYEAMQSMRDCEGTTTSPSQILRIKFDDDYRTAVISEPYANDGKEVSGSSMAALYSNQMLIGTVCKGLLHCEFADSSVL